MTTLLESSPPKVLPPRPSEFLSSWFAYVPADQIIELRAISAGDRSVLQEWFTLEAVPDLVGRAFELTEEYDVYFGVCPRIQPRGDKASVTFAPGLWADLDFKRFEDGEAGALRRLAVFPLPPTWITGTGGGFHLFWRLKEVAQADAAFEARLKGIARALNADPAATDRSRVLRVPGTWNLRRDFQVRIISWPTST